MYVLYAQDLFCCNRVEENCGKLALLETVCSSGWPSTQILLPHKGWNYRCVPPCLVQESWCVCVCVYLHGGEGKKGGAFLEGSEAFASTNSRLSTVLLTLPTFPAGPWPWLAGV